MKRSVLSPLVAAAALLGGFMFSGPRRKRREQLQAEEAELLEAQQRAAENSAIFVQTGAGVFPKASARGPTEAEIKIVAPSPQEAEFLLQMKHVRGEVDRGLAVPARIICDDVEENYMERRRIQERLSREHSHHVAAAAAPSRCAPKDQSGGYRAKRRHRHLGKENRHA